MELQLKNIGMLKEANVKIDGLTVIAGENDTGKSTVGKALFIILDSSMAMFSSDRNERASSLVLKYLDTLFKKQINDKASILLKTKDNTFKINFTKKSSINISTHSDFPLYKLPIFIESPLAWNFIDFFKDIALVESQMNIKLDYPYFMKDLSFKMSIKSNNKDYVNVKDELIDLMGGEFKKDDLGKYYFEKKDIGRVEIVNTATGIKSFGILQMLSQNGWLNNESVLILDEPEVHLHPKWQLEMAKVIIEFVKNGVKVLVNSHSPYMIEALKRYSDKEKQENKTNFYLAEDGYIKQINNNNSETLEKIFIKLSEPFDIFEELDMERLLNGDD